ncbi:MAG TPA: biotin synthase BioB [Bacteroidales bacterium]|nr:MAG: Biotin synthase [Bacteroidetes bacterium ADurb.Bin217]HOS84319.1 biotin synthase BioB [Bacteroidales bacterium]HPM12244.1 biotin synthase BioB [Bacteroidales bacterium]
MIDLQKLTEDVCAGKALTHEEGVALTQYPDKEALYEAADRIRTHFCGNNMDLCSITNAKSGRCSQNCKWCSQSAHHTTNIEEYDLIEKDRAVHEALESAKAGVHRHSLVTSGKAVSDKTLNSLLDIYKEIRQQSSINLCASMGLITKEQLQKLKAAGISHYHCNLETAPSFFPNVCTTHTIQDKIDVILAAQSLGMRVCSGGIIGMGETMEQRVELACALRDLNILSIPINILTPIEGTPLQNSNELTEEEILTTIAVFRFINPKANLRFAGGRLKIKTYQHKALHAGINSALTGNYLTTIGSNTADDIRDFTASGFTIER